MYVIRYGMLSRWLPLPSRLVASTVVALMAISSLSCRQSQPPPLVVFFGIDGATAEVINDLRFEGRLPAFERLIDSGTFGPMQSMAARRIMSDDPRHTYSSPIVWTTIATGKVPEKHGIRDFVLPIDGTSSVWMGSEEEPARAELTLPELSGRGPLTLLLRLHSHVSVGEQSVQILLNETALETIRCPIQWMDFSISLPGELLRPAKNRLALVFSRQSRPVDRGESSDRRRLAGELASLSIVDARGETIFSLDPVYQRFSLGRGFYMPRAKLTEVQSVHWRSLPLWSLLGDLGHPVGIIGYWGTWPAYEVNGFLVSSRMGIRVQRRGSTRLTWPTELADELRPLDPSARDLEELFDRLGVSECEPPLIEEKSVLRKIVTQDELYFRIARQLLPSMDRGFFSVYFRSIDVASHLTLHWRHGAELRPGCPESVREVVDNTYVQIDRWLGALLEILPDNATVVLVSDHGMRPGENLGHHDPFGIFLAAGDNLRKGADFYGASVLDVAPTVLHMFGAPIPLDMDGKVLVQVFERIWLDENPPRYVEADTSYTSGEKAEDDEVRDEILEQLRKLGYIQ